jgi:hypothetical protein
MQGKVRNTVNGDCIVKSKLVWTSQNSKFWCVSNTCRIKVHDKNSTKRYEDVTAVEHRVLKIQGTTKVLE